MFSITPAVGLIQVIGRMKCFIKHRSVHLLIPYVKVRLKRWIKISYHRLLRSVCGVFSVSNWTIRTTYTFSIKLPLRLLHPRGCQFASNSLDGQPVRTLYIHRQNWRRWAKFSVNEFSSQAGFFGYWSIRRVSNITDVYGFISERYLIWIWGDLTDR